MKIAYFDCFSGVSGDMILGALVDTGVPLKELRKGLGGLAVTGYRLTGKKVRRASLSATKVDVVLTGKAAKERPVRWHDVERLIDESSLSEPVREKGRGIFRRIFAAEARVHGEPMEKVHLHELGAVDCMVDIFGTLIGLELLGVEQVSSSALNLGGGFVRTDHGILPVPAPATAELLKGVPVYSSGVPHELTTPTGAAIIRSLCTKFGEMPHFILEKTGIGAGGRDTEGFPNALRLFVGEKAAGLADEQVCVMETNIDDMNPQVFGYLVDMLLGKGALDVFMTGVMMKKTRPGTMLTVLCPPEKKEVLADIILRETTSIGLRFHETSRIVMKREIRSVKTRYGTVRVKTAQRGDIVKMMPEYDDCRKAAEKAGVPLIKVIEEAGSAAKKGPPGRR